jgi:hypothetical protein
MANNAKTVYFAHRLLASNVPLRFLKFTSMPHVFQGVIAHLDVSRRSFEYMGEFIRAIFEGGKVKTGQVRVHPNEELKEDNVVPEEELSLGGLNIEDVIAWMRAEVKLWREEEEEGRRANEKEKEVARL